MAKPLTMHLFRLTVHPRMPLFPLQASRPAILADAFRGVEKIDGSGLPSGVIFPVSRLSPARRQR
jgi:hypothetical protein